MPKTGITKRYLPEGLHFTIFALAAGSPLPEEIQLLPHGEVQSQKGNFLADDQAVAAILSAFAKKVNDIVIDYEHQTLTGEQAPAAGWIKELINKGAEGLWAKVEWTPRAQEYIRNKEYRYLSPVVLVRKSDNRAVLIHSAALTNTPAIDGMTPIANKFETEDIETMDFLKKLALKLGLAETATEDEVINAVMALQAAPAVANKEVLTALSLTDKATLDDVKAAIVALKGPGFDFKQVLSTLGLPETATVDQAKGAIIALKNPSGYVRAEEFKALKDELDQKKRDDLVDLALKSGKITPAQKKWAEEIALKDPAGFKAFLDTAPQVVPLDKINAGDPPARNTVPDEVQVSVNKALGISEEEFKKFNQ
jgi:phage I-like protein